MPVQSLLNLSTQNKENQTKQNSQKNPQINYSTSSYFFDPSFNYFHSQPVYASPTTHPIIMMMQNENFNTSYSTQINPSFNQKK
ncbi:hypothetical protein M0811_14401 [Anaeramoeba ignava]|uniref:Uncharacterized protein n=1 Tax=Anaeramoeba ignava TaxID=1746090 RepID=A0A9Q0LV45_ANAIG|nr:hypothetical protein M0811_14401 [Anaeramoeba ignava]